MRAFSAVAMAHKIDELPIYSKVVEFWGAVNALLDRPRLRNDGDLYDQISRANESIPSNMVEGFEQGTDKAFANYLTYSKASLAEVLRRLKRAYFKKHITADELEARLVLTFINTVAFGRRCIPPRGVARRSNTPGILSPRALRGGRLGALGASPYL
jgi:four helix bundle protein